MNTEALSRTMADTDARSPEGVAVLPLRFSDDAAAMISFLQVLGMRPTVSDGRERFAVLVAGGGGRVMVHATPGAQSGAASGETQLCLSVHSTDEAAENLRARGLEVRVWDETYGRQGSVRGPRGEDIALNEQQRDLYGYVGHDAEGADARLAVTVVRGSAAGADRDRDVEFFGEFGFVPRDAGSQARQALGAQTGGAIGLHAPGGESYRISRPSGSEFGDVALVQLGFETTEPLEELAQRLSDAGYPAQVVVEGEARKVHVTDPDGQHLEIHARA